MSLPTDWYEIAPSGSPDNYVTTCKVRFSWRNPPAWIYAIMSKADYYHDYGSFYADPNAAEPTLICCVAPGFYFDVSVIGGNAKTLPGALPHDLIYSLADAMANFYGVSVRTILHIADHWFLATLRMTGWAFKRTYFCAVRAFGYEFNRLGRWLRGAEDKQ